MDDQIFFQFERARDEFLRNNIPGFIDALTELYTKHLTCNCYLRNQTKGTWRSFYNYLERIVGNSDDFQSNLARGFVYSYNGRDDLAYKFLSHAIEVHPRSEVALSMRATLTEYFNPFRLEDAQKLVTLNPSARNYYLLGSAYGDGNVTASIECIEKAIILNSEFACAYNSLARRYKHLGENKLAIDAYLNCLALNPSHWCYIELWQCLIEEGEVGSAIEYLKVGHNHNYEDRNYYYALAVSNQILGNYSDAYRYFNEFVPYGYSDQPKIEDQVAEIRILAEARWQFGRGNAKYSNELFEKYIFLGHDLFSDNLTTYYQNKLKLANPKISLGPTNFYRIKFRGLKESNTNKLINKENITEDEQNIDKLMLYKGYSKLGFGKYSGYLIQHVIEIDAAYIIWAIINLVHFSIDHPLFLEHSLLSNNNSLLALEINLIKNDLLREWKEEERESNWSGDHPNYDQWLDEEFGDDAGIAYWNLD